MSVEAAVLEDEARWVAAAQAGDQEAFRALVRAHQPIVLGYALAKVKDEAIARDLAQEVFLTFWRCRGEYEHRGKLRAYLLSIARNRVLAQHGRRRAQLRLLEAVERAPTPPRPGVEDVERRALRRGLEAAIAKLPEAQSEAVRLRFVLGLPVAEVAAVLGVAEGTVKSRVSRALKDLREELER